MSSAIQSPVPLTVVYNEPVNATVPRQFDVKRAQQLLRSVNGGRAAGARIDSVSKALVGFPYQPNTLVGSAHSAEIFTVGFESFDCVTFIETVLALAQSTTTSRFLERLRNIRYASGKIEWKSRNHYMTEWIRNNVREGAVTRITALKPTREKHRLLNVVPGLPARRTKFACIPKTQFMKRAEDVGTGDLIFFASTRPQLDVFHCGIIIKNHSGLKLRHASRSGGAVVEQDLQEFLKQNRMAGVIVVRPAEVL